MLRQPADPGSTGQERHPAFRVYARMPERQRAGAAVEIPTDVDDATVEVDGRRVALTNLRKIYFPELGADQGRPASLLRAHLRRSDPAHRRSRHRHEALSARRHRRLLLYEARAVAASALDPHLLDRAQLRQLDRLRRRRRPGVAALAHQPRLHRSQPMVLAVRRSRPPDVPPLRPRSHARRNVRRRARSRADRSRRTARARHDALRQNDGKQGRTRLRRDTQRPHAARRLGGRQRDRSPHGQGAPRRAHRDLSRCESSARATCSSTTIKTRSAKRSPRSIPSVRTNARRYRRRSPGRSSKTAASSPIHDLQRSRARRTHRRPLEAAAAQPRPLQPRQVQKRRRHAAV